MPSPVSACASGSEAVALGMGMIRDGRADVVVVGGTEASIHPMTIAAFANIRALSGRVDDPQTASRPYDVDRDGFVMGEGAGMVVIEELEHAKARGARIYAEIIGYGLSGDAFHITAPAEDGDGAYRCMQAAVKRAGIDPAEVRAVAGGGERTGPPPVGVGENRPVRYVRPVVGQHAVQGRLEAPARQEAQRVADVDNDLARTGLDVLPRGPPGREGLEPPLRRPEDRQRADVGVHVLAHLVWVLGCWRVVQEVEGGLGAAVVAVVRLEPGLALEPEPVGQAVEQELGDEVARCGEVVEQRKVLTDDGGEGPAAGQLVLADLQDWSVSCAA